MLASLALGPQVERSKLPEVLGEPDRPRFTSAVPDASRDVRYRQSVEFIIATAGDPGRRLDR